MSKLTIDKKRELAQILYTQQHLTQKEVAERVEVSAVTVNKWCKKFKWDELRATLSITREEQLKYLYNQLGELNKEIAGRENRYPSASEADTITKLAAAINKLETETGVAEIISSFKGFLAWLKEISLEEAQKLIPYLDAYVKEKLR